MSKTIKIAAMSDLHGYLPDVKSMKKSDVMIIAGDIFPVDIQRDMPACEYWLRHTLMPYLDSIPAERVVMTPGNHDFFLYNSYLGALTFDMKQFLQSQENIMGDRLVYLIDESWEYKGMHFYATPWVHNLVRWAFYSPDTNRGYSKVPDGVDVLITHQPPSAGKAGTSHPNTPIERNYGDINLDRLLFEKHIKYNVCGHVHTGVHGGVKYYDTTIYNVSVINERYAPAYDVTYFSI